MAGTRSSPAPGDAAPDIALGELGRLADYRTKRRVVLVLGPMDATDLKTLRALDAAREHLDALRTLAIAVGPGTTGAQAKRVARMGVKLPVKSDWTTMRQYGALGPLGLVARRAVVVDGRGVVRLVMRGVAEVEKILVFLDALRGDVE